MPTQDFQKIFEEDVLPMISSSAKDFSTDWDRWWVDYKSTYTKLFTKSLHDAPCKMYDREICVIKAIIRSDYKCLEHMVNPFPYSIDQNLNPDGSSDECCCSGQSMKAGYPCSGESFESYVPVEDEKGVKTFLHVPMCTGCVSLHWYLWLKRETLLLPPGYTVEFLIKEDRYVQADAVYHAFNYQYHLLSEKMSEDTGLPYYACTADVFSELCKEKAGIDDYILRKYWEAYRESGGPSPRIFGSPFPSKLEDFLENG